MKRSPKTKEQSRSAQSRRQVIDAVANLVAREGISKATTAKIAKEAECSWGVLQYQFGGKIEILQAVLQDSTDSLVQSLTEFQPNSNSPQKSIESAINLLWDYHDTTTYRAAIEILLNYSHDTEDFLEIGTEARSVLLEFFQGVFKDCGYTISKNKVETIAEIILSSLRGMAVGNGIFPALHRDFAKERRLLAKMVEAELAS